MEVGRRGGGWKVELGGGREEGQRVGCGVRYRKGR